MKYNSPLYKILGIFIVAIILLFLAIGLVGCSFQRSMQKSESATNEKKNVDSVSVKKTENKSTSSEDWERIIERFGHQPAQNIAGDTNIYISQNFPVERIYERGSKSQSEESKTSDSTLYNIIAELQQKLNEKSVESETQVLNIWHMIGISAIVGVVLILLSKLKIGLR